MKGRYLYNVPITGKDLGPGMSSNGLGSGLLTWHDILFEHDRAYKFFIVPLPPHSFTCAYIIIIYFTRIYISYWLFYR